MGFLDKLKGDGVRAVAGIAKDIAVTAMDKATTMKESFDGPDNFPEALDDLVQHWRGKGTSDVAIIRALAAKSHKMADEGVTL